MNRQEFIRELNQLLSDIPDSDRMDAIKYYNDYFDEAGYENEAKVIQELGSPQKVAENIKEDLHRSNYSQPYEEPAGYQKESGDTSKTILIVILLILSSPVWGSLLIGLFGGAVGVIAGLIGAGVGFLVGGAACSFAGIMTFAANALEGIVTLGMGCLLMSLGVLCILLFALITFKWLPMLVKVCAKGVKNIFHREEGGNEI